LDKNTKHFLSTLNIGLKILSKKITLKEFHEIIRLELFGFRNKEVCINLFVSVRVIC